MSRLLLSVAVALVLLVGGAGPAGAHAILQATSPVDGSVVEVAPGEIMLQFSEPVNTGLGSIRIYDSAGTAVPTGEPEIVDEDPSRLRVDLPDELAEGTYVVTWAVTSADAHPIEGAFVFSVGSESADDSALAAIFARSRAGDVPLAIAASVLRALVYAGSLLAAGGVIFLLWVHDRSEAERRPLTRIPVAGAGLAALASVIGLAVQAMLLSGRGAGGLTDAGVVGGVLETSFGVSALVRLAGLALLGVALPRLWRPAAMLASGAGAAIALASFALTGHTATTDPRWLVVGANLSHTLAGAAWLGGLALLLVALRRRRAADDPVGGGRMVARFSTLATGAILLVSAAGAGLAWAQVRAVRALVSTTYGWTLLGKVAIVAAVLVVGAYNNRRLVPAIRRRSGAAWQILRRTVRYEVIGLLLVAVLTGVLVNIRPARSAAGVGEAFSQYVDLGEEYQLNVTVDPNAAGVNDVHLYLLGADGRPVDAARDLTLAFSMPAKDIARIERDPSVVGPGHWTHSGPELSIPGPWVIDVTARVGDFDQVSAEIPVTVN